MYLKFESTYNVTKPYGLLGTYVLYTPYKPYIIYLADHKD